MTVGVTGLPSGLTYSTTTGKVSGTVAGDATVKEYTATITASDGANPDETEDFTVTITASAVLQPEPDNRPPAISDPGDRTYAQGETIPAFSIEAEDPDGDAPEVTLSGLPPGLGYAASSGQVSGTVSADAAVGSYPVTITASDAVATAVELTFSITVTEGVPTNRPPEFDEGRWAARDIGAHARGAVGAPVAATDPDGDALTYTVVESNPHLALDAATGQLRVRPDAELRPRTNLRIELGVSDGKDAVHEPQDAVDDTIVVTVRIAGPHPGLVLSQTAAALREGGEPVRYEATLASEPAGAVTVALTSRDPAAVEVSPTELRFTRQDWSTTQPVTLHPVRDEDFAPERVVVIHDISSAADRGYDALADVELTATVEDPAGAPEDDPDYEDEDDPERDGAAPRPKRLRIVSVPAHPTQYAAGETIRAEVVFNGRVLVPGNPTLAFRVGAETRTASYLSGSGTNTLLFEYRLPFGERDEDGVGIPQNALRGRIHSQAGESALLVHPALPDDAEHRVDAVRPTISAVAMASRPASGDIYRAGETVRVRMGFDEPVRISGTATVSLVIGGVTRAARISGMGPRVSNQAVLAYRVMAGDRDDDGVSVTGNSLSFAPGVIADRVGNPVAEARVEADAGRAAHGERLLRGHHPHLPDQDGHKVLTEAPGLLGGLPDLTLVVGSPPAFVEAAPIFADARSYAAASSAAEIAAVAVEGSVVVVDPVAVGAASVRVLGSNPVGTAEQVFRVTVVDDPAERAVVKGVLWGLGRSLLASATATIGERLSGAPGGTRLPFPESAGRSSGTGGRLRAAFLPWEAEDPASAAGGSGLGVSELVERGFALAPGPAPGTSLRWSLWGAGDFHAFGGGLGEVSGFDGDLRAPYVGLDVAGDRWLAGVSASRAAGSADYRFLGASRGAGRLQVEMVNVFPYFRYSLGENSEVWTIVGGGRGAAAREGAGEQSDLALRMGAAGFRRNLRTLGPLAFSLRADAGIALLGTGGTGPFANLSSRAVRYRLGFETSATAGLGRLGTLVPFAAFSGRYDGGDASVETGNGLELAGGVRFSSPAARVRIEAQGRMLAAHSGGYRERGFSLLAQVSSGPDGRGWTALVTPRLGAETHRRRRRALGRWFRRRRRPPLPAGRERRRSGCPGGLRGGSRGRAG